MLRDSYNYCSYVTKATHREQLQPGKYSRSQSVILQKQETGFMLLEDKIDADVFPILPATYN